MNRRLFLLTSAAVVAAGATTWRAVAADGKPAAPVVMLKLDDLARHKGAHATVSPRWQKLVDFLEAEKIKASLGILTDSLEGDCPEYCDWIKKQVAGGLIEIWDHGHYSRGIPESMKVGTRKAENEGGTVEEQAAMFRKSLSLVQEKLGLEMHAFGPHSTHLDGTTYEALKQFPQIKAVWFYGPPKGTQTDKVVIQRLMNLEVPLFVPNPAKVKEDFEKKRATLPYVAIQGHPNQWDDERFENFKKAVLYLREQGCRFVTISEYLADHAAK